MAYIVLFCADAETFSPEPVFKEEAHEAEEAGSFSPVLLHGDENEEAIDPEEDRAILVTFVTDLLPIILLISICGLTLTSSIFLTN